MLRTLLEERVWGPLPEGASVALLLYAAVVGLGILPLLLHGLLAAFGFGPKPGLGRHFIGYMGANVLHDALGQLAQAFVAIIGFGLIGLIGTLRGWGEPVTCLWAGCLGGMLFVLVGVALPQLNRLDRLGRLEKLLVGTTAIVRAEVPGQQAGEGVIVSHYPRRGTAYLASTGSEAILPGRMVRVVQVLSEEQLLVVAEAEACRDWLAGRASALNRDAACR